MSDKSASSWADATWSPVTGCDPISQGCKNCYAKREVEQRWSKNPKSVFFGRDFNDVQCHVSALDQPMRWKKPKKIFVCPRADLFHDEVPFGFIDLVFSAMELSRQHIFQVLTKRAERMRTYIKTRCWYHHPLPNVWLGVSVEDQAAADERIPLLLDMPAAVRWISAEPLLGPVDLNKVRHTPKHSDWTYCWNALSGFRGHKCGGTDNNPRLDWVIVGGESGQKARPMHPDWATSLRDQCETAGVAYYFKQWGAWIPMMGHAEGIPVRGEKFIHPDGTIMGYAGRKAGRRLDGVIHDAYPEVQR